MANKKCGKQSIKFLRPVNILSSYSIVGQKEGNGNFKDYFDYILKDDKFGEDTFEHAERRLIESSIVHCIERAHLNIGDIDLMLAGDLLNQITSSSFTARKLNATFVGLYGACSTMAESLAVGACMVDGGYFNNVVCATGSHFSSAERQYRFPLELGNQRPPTSQWTVTGAGCSILTSNDVPNCNKIYSATFGKVTDYGVTDVNNMGAAMAPAACSTLIAHFEDMHTSPSDYDLILTGDLGKFGSEILLDLMEHNGYKLGRNYSDCGQMIFNDNQKTYQGGSGAGCSASVVNSYVMKKLREGTFNRVLFLATGALLSSTSSQQGDSIPGICHAVEIRRE